MNYIGISMKKKINIGSIIKFKYPIWWMKHHNQAGIDLHGLESEILKKFYIVLSVDDKHRNSLSVSGIVHTSGKSRILLKVSSNNVVAWIDTSIEAVAVYC